MNRIAPRLRRAVARGRAWWPRHGYQLLFAAALALLLALGSWWVLFIRQSIEEGYLLRLQNLLLEARAEGARLGHAETPPPLGPLVDVPALETVPADDDPLLVSLAPNWPALALRARPEELAALRTRFERQYLMWAGEGGLLMTLILFMVFMLYRMAYVSRRSMQEIDRFVSTATHELKTPIAGVKALLQTAAMGRIEPDDLAGLAGMGLREVNRLEHLVENLLTRDRLRRAAHLARERVDLARLAEQLAEHRRATGEGVPLVSGPASLPAWADADAVRAILENLLDNAQKYGGPAPARLTLRRGASRARVEVAGDGAWAPDEDLERIFQPFYRTHGGSAGGVRHGAGLGLFISRELARRLGGDLTAENRPEGPGTWFVLRLPPAEADADAAQ